MLKSHDKHFPYLCMAQKKPTKTLRQGCRAQRSSLIISKSKQEINKKKCNNEITETRKKHLPVYIGGGGGQ